MKIYGEDPPLRERWSDEARRRSAEVRRAQAAARRSRLGEPSRKAKINDIISPDTARAYRVHRAQTFLDPGSEHGSVQRSYDPLTHTLLAPPKIRVGTEGDSKNVLSVARHEVGHLDDAWAQKGNPYMISGRRASGRYAMEFHAWRTAVRDAPFNRVRWSKVEQALLSYRRGDGDAKHLSDETLRAQVRKDVATLQRYGRKLRRHDTTPAGLHEANDCHEPAGSSKGGQFCSGGGTVSVERAFTDPTLMSHGSRAPYDTLQPGSMFSDSPVWAAGYTTKLSPFGDSETFVGAISVFKVPTGKVIYTRTVHQSEGMLIDLARQYGGDVTKMSMKQMAEHIAKRSDVEAILARDPATGKITGGTLVRAHPVIGHIDPVEALRYAKTVLKHEIPSNLARAMKEANPCHERFAGKTIEARRHL